MPNPTIRTLFGLLLAAGLAAPLSAHADEATFQDYLEIDRLFTGGLDTGALRDGTYVQLIAPSVRGSWAALSIAGTGLSQTAFDDYVSRACDDRPILVNPVGPYRIAMQRTTIGATLATDYVYIGGSTFAPHVDPIDVMAFLQLDRAGLEAIAVTTFADFQADTQLLVVDDSMFVALRSGRPETFVRCPGDDRVGDADLAVEDVLWRSFEGSLNALDAATRSQYLDCGRNAFRPLDREGIAELVAAIDGGQATAALFAEAHPVMIDALAACNEALPD